MAQNMQYTRNVYLDSFFMPEGRASYYTKHEGPLKTQTHEQHHQQHQQTQQQLQAVNQDPDDWEILEHNRERARLRALSESVRLSETRHEMDRFPTPPPAQHPPALLPNATYLTAKPHKAVLDTDHIPDNIWYSDAFQLAPDVYVGERDYMDVIEVAYIAGKLFSSDARILREYKDDYPLSHHSEVTLIRVICEVRLRAKEGHFLPEETQLIGEALLEDITDADTVFAKFQQKWDLYPKSREYVRRMWTRLTGPSIQQGHT